jgi:predicted RNA-binding protein with EMAP domain
VLLHQRSDDRAKRIIDRWQIIQWHKTVLALANVVLEHDFQCIDRGKVGILPPQCHWQIMSQRMFDGAKRKQSCITTHTHTLADEPYRMIRR